MVICNAAIGAANETVVACCRGVRAVGESEGTVA